MQNFSVKLWICAGKLDGSTVDTEGRNAYRNIRRRRKCGDFFFADGSDLVYPVELLKVWKNMRIYVIWCACILYSYFQNAFDKVPCQKSWKKLKDRFDQEGDAFWTDDYLKERKWKVGVNCLCLKWREFAIEDWVLLSVGWTLRQQHVLVLLNGWGSADK